MFATCSEDEIRIFSASNGRELLKIEIVQEIPTSPPKCNCIELMADGKSIVSGWTDGILRTFLPQSGKLFWLIKDAHATVHNDIDGVTCVCTTQDCEHVVSGGIDGEIKLWSIGKQVKKLISGQKLHVGQVTSLKMIDS